MRNYTECCVFYNCIWLDFWMLLRLVLYSCFMSMYKLARSQSPFSAFRLETRVDLAQRPVVHRPQVSHAFSTRVWRGWLKREEFSVQDQNWGCQWRFFIFQISILYKVRMCEWGGAILRAGFALGKAADRNTALRKVRAMIRTLWLYEHLEHCFFFLSCVNLLMQVILLWRQVLNWNALLSRFWLT